MTMLRVKKIPFFILRACFNHPANAGSNLKVSPVQSKFRIFEFQAHWKRWIVSKPGGNHFTGRCFVNGP